MADNLDQKPVDRTAAETLIRTSVMALANGAPIRDLDQLVSRNASRISHADIMAGRLGSDVLGDIIGTVEQAKGNTAFNWSAATPEQMKAYLAANGFAFADHGAKGVVLSRESRDGASPGHETPAANISFGKIDQNNFASTSFHAAGLSWGTFATLRQQGFDSSQIMAAVSTNKQLGLGANDNTAATARLQRDVPSAIPGLHATHDNWKGVHELEKAEKEARANGQSAQADQLKGQIEAARKRAEEHDKKEQERVRNERPERVPDLIDRQKAIQKATTGHIAELTLGKDAPSGARADDPAKKAEIAANTAIIENYRRNPEDAKARADYTALTTHTARDSRTKHATVALKKNLAEDEKLKKSEVVKTARDKTKGDDDLAALNDESPAKTTTRAAEATKSKEEKPSTEKSKPNIAAGAKKLAQSKPANLTA